MESSGPKPAVLVVDDEENIRKLLTQELTEAGYVVSVAANGREAIDQALALARRGKPYNQPHLMADLPEVRDRYIDALKIQQMDHMERSLEYCRKTLNLGVKS
jgi:CheY-like chemotaxis protein